ncbi:MAG: cytochrome c oxidase subunit 3 family protein [Bacteroides sp.]|jgi:cytochrome c oxidase subunit 3|nr:cytochrome c oxidase subunit 3 family protein [Bacteroides sp.]
MIEHRDDLASKMGMWLFIFTELLLFGMLFVVYAVYRSMHPEAFKLAGQELDVVLGTLNTVILLISSMTVAMSISAIQKGNKKLALALLTVTLIIAVVFLVNKYFEWGTKVEYGFNPGGAELHQLGHGTILFFGLYFVMTGLHALHILIGIGLFLYVFWQVRKDKIHQTDYIWLENTGLYWHLVDLIWIFLFPLLYLIH